MHLHANLLTACRAYVEAFPLGPADRWLIVTPFTHLTAFGIPFLTGALAAGGSVALLEAWDPESALDRIERHRITHLVGAPPMLIDLARRPDLPTRELSSLRFLMYAGAPCPVDFLRRLQSQLGCGLAVFYGWTEGLAHTLHHARGPPRNHEPHRWTAGGGVLGARAQPLAGLLPPARVPQGPLPPGRVVHVRRHRDPQPRRDLHLRGAQGRRDQPRRPENRPPRGRGAPLPTPQGRARGRGGHARRPARPAKLRLRRPDPRGPADAGGPPPLPRREGARPVQVARAPRAGGLPPHDAHGEDHAIRTPRPGLAPLRRGGTRAEAPSGTAPGP